MEKLYRSGYLCHPQQAYTLRQLTFAEGKARGARLIEVATAGGLQLDILPDSGLDVGQARYRGANVTFLSKNGYDGPASDLPWENEFMNYFSGGLIYTSGLRNSGPANRDGGEWHPLHGRCHGISAQQVSARVEGDEIVVSGVLRETSHYGQVLQLERSYRIPIFGSELRLRDRITNLTPHSEEFTLMYHCNFGWPLLSEGARVELPAQRKTTARTPFAEEFLGRECGVDRPAPGEEERVFFHEDMERAAALINPGLGVRMEMRWSESLPILIQWRTMASGDYALGLMPSNCYIMGRSAERENGTLPALGPFESFETELAIRLSSAPEASASVRRP